MKLHTIFILISLCIAGNAVAWNPASDVMLTQWGESLDPAKVHQEYPRPQMKRGEWLSLNGLWEYAIIQRNAVEPKSYDGEILVPFSPQSALSGVGRDVTANDEIWYRRSFRIPHGWKGKRVLLNFGAVDWKAEVWINGVKVGSHTGGYTPFTFDVTPALDNGDNILIVKVWDPGQSVKHPIGKQHDTAETIWYTNQSGIWQTVWLEPVSAAHITRLKLTPDLDRKFLSIEVLTSVVPDALVDVTLIDGGGRRISAKGYANIPFELSMPEWAELWSPDNPKLYSLEVKLLLNGKVVDKVDSYTAFRKFSIAKCDKGNVRLMLNDRPLFHFGLLDQGWWPDGLYTAPSDEALRYDLEKTKEWGFNMVRKHIKVEPATWYAHCDSLGLIVWQDMPSIDGFPPAGVWDMPRYKIGPEMEYSEWEKENYYKEWGEIIDLVYNSPSVGVYVPFNEAWGQFDTVKTTEWTKTYDPTRLVNPASGGNNFPVGDILDWHHYPDPVMFARDPDRANVVGEYGGLGLVVPGHRWNNGEIFQYAGFADSDALCDEYEVQGENLLRLVQQGISAGVYTQTTDVENEINGLMTYDRKVVKIDEQRIRRINRRIVSCLNDK